MKTATHEKANPSTIAQRNGNKVSIKPKIVMLATTPNVKTLPFLEMSSPLKGVSTVGKRKITKMKLTNEVDKS